MKGASDSKPDGDTGALVTWVRPCVRRGLGWWPGVFLCKQGARSLLRAMSVVD